MRYLTRASAGIWLFVMATGLIGRGQDGVSKDATAASNKEEDNRKLVARWKLEAAEYTIVARTEPETRLSLKAEPVLHWTNPVREADDGLVFLWLVRGRPEVVSCFYRARWEGRLTEAHEFHSLATVPLTATRGGRTVWSPKVAGVTLRPIPGAPKVAATPAERLRQMRNLAREFRASVDVEKGRTELRQLSQPVYRYEAQPGGSPDGALFGFVLTTDPEAWLQIEERKGSDGPLWHYAFARMSDHSLSAHHRDRVVWEVPKSTDNGNPSNAFCSRWDVGPRP